MRKILLIFAHPRFEHSTINRRLIAAARQVESVTVHDLYEQYADFNIDIAAEQELLRQHELIIWHHPFYWYSCPPLMKQWIDLVLAFNWAYGPKGQALAGKFAMNAITTGGAMEAYQPGGRNRFTINQMLVPFDQTATLCKMEYLPPYAVQGTHQLDEESAARYARQYAELLTWLGTARNQPGKLKSFSRLNDFIELKILTGNGE